MKTGRIIHQQIVQLRWHFLACMGLMMALPIEEAFISLKNGDGFYATGISLGIPITIAPLLAGLIACANVQADLDEKRYLFWRSKPIGVKSFIAVKFIVGLLIAFVIIASPVVFTLISCKILQYNEIGRNFLLFAINFQLISLLAYSLCFFCNVLVRKTARAWLIGLAMTCFLLLVPFILPLNFIDMTGDFLFAASAVYISVTLGASLGAFVISLFAASRDWHLKTNLKGLLWTGAAMIFLLMMLFARQVANIKVLDEIEIQDRHIGIGGLQRIDDTLRWNLRFEVETSDQKIKLKDNYTEPSEDLLKQLQNQPRLYQVEEGLGLDMYPSLAEMSYNNGRDTYIFRLNAYYRERKKGKRGTTIVRDHEKVYLCSYKLLEGFHSIGVSALDLSDCIYEEDAFHMAMRQIGDKLVVFIKDSYAVIQIKEDGSLELIDKKVDGLKGFSRRLTSTDKIFKLPLLPVQGISIEERVKLSLDINYCYGRWRQAENLHRYSLTDISGDKISFCLLDEYRISRFDVVKWDEENIYCRLRDQRPFMFLEQMFGQLGDRDTYFVRDGKLYAYEYQKLSVFDVRSNRIRKLGHFQRITEDYFIQDMELLDDGNILLCCVWERYPGHSGRDYLLKWYLKLLKNPE